MIELFRQALVVQTFIDAQGWHACFIGGVALQHWGEPRATRDIDLSLFTGFGGEATFVDRLLRSFPARVEDARRFALDHRVLLLRTAAPSAVDVDIALAALPFEDEMIGRAIRVEFQPGVKLRICSAEDLLVMKAFAHRLQDRADVLGIARRRGPELDWSAIRDRLEPLAAVKDEPDIMASVARLEAEFGR